MTTTTDTHPAAGQGARLYSTQATIGQAEIAPPHNFGFQLRHYVTAPEAREGNQLVELLRLASGGLVKVDIASQGTVHTPRLQLTISSSQPLTPAQAKEARDQVAWRLSLDQDLRPFYALAQRDPVLSASIAHNFGAKGKRAPPCSTP